MSSRMQYIEVAENILKIMYKYIWIQMKGSYKEMQFILCW